MVRCSFTNGTGGIMVEFLVVTSFFIVLLAAVFDFSLAIQEQSVMSDAARMAARAAMRQELDIALVSDAARSTAYDFLTNSGYVAADYTIETKYKETPLGLGLISVNVRRTNGRRLLFVPHLAIFSSQTSVFPISGNICPSGGSSC